MFGERIKITGDINAVAGDGAADLVGGGDASCSEKSCD